MFTAINKETKQPVTIYGTHYFEPKQFNHNGYIGFLIFDEGKFFYANSNNFII